MVSSSSLLRVGGILPAPLQCCYQFLSLAQSGLVAMGGVLVGGCTVGGQAAGAEQAWLWHLWRAFFGRHNGGNLPVLASGRLSTDP